MIPALLAPLFKPIGLEQMMIISELRHRCDRNSNGLRGDAELYAADQEVAIRMMGGIHLPKRTCYTEPYLHPTSGEFGWA